MTTIQISPATEIAISEIREATTRLRKALRKGDSEEAAEAIREILGSTSIIGELNNINY